MGKPLIGLLTNTFADKTGDCDAERLSVSSRYVMALEDLTNVHCVGLLFKNKLDMDILNRLDGVLFTGGFANVDPKFYNGTYELKPGEQDILRDTTAWAVLERSIQIGLPVLGICRGLQEINVYHGGSLQGDVHLKSGNFEHIKNFDDGRFDFEPRQRVKVLPDSLLSEWIGGQDIININSAHGQAIDILGDNLQIEAICPDDGIIEAIRLCNHPNFGYAVQWHPESRTCREDKISKIILQKFSEACITYRQSLRNNRTYS